MMNKNQQITINYTNWKGATRDRLIVPIKVWFGKTEWYQQEQWFLTALDVAKDEEREFAMVGINGINALVKTTQAELDLSVSEIVASNGSGAVKLYTDGGSRGNPGPSAIGFVIYDDQDKLLFKDSKYLGITTNNQAEYQGLKEGLVKCKSLNFHEVAVHMDSLLVVNQMKGIYKVKNRDLWPIYESLVELQKDFKKITFTHVPRELNKVADSMVNECLDSEID